MAGGTILDVDRLCHVSPGPTSNHQRAQMALAPAFEAFQLIGRPPGRRPDGQELVLTRTGSEPKGESMPTFAAEKAEIRSSVPPPRVSLPPRPRTAIPESFFFSEPELEVHEDKRPIGPLGISILGLAACLMIVINWLIGGTETKKDFRPRGARVNTAIHEVELTDETGPPQGPGGAEERRISGTGEEASAPTDTMVNAASIARDLVSLFLDGSDEDREEVASARFLNDLQYNLLMLRLTDLSQLAGDVRGMYWLTARAPHELPPRVDNDPGKTGTTVLSILFLDGRWKLHDLSTQ